MSELLSQEQLDQLLASGGFSTGDSDDSGSAAAETTDDGNFDALKTTFELFAREMSSVLTTVISKKVGAELTECAKADLESLKSGMGPAVLCIAVPFKNGFSGNMYLCLKKTDIAVLADLMMMGEGNVPYSPEHNDAILELTNQICSSFALELGGVIGTQVSVSPSTMTGSTLEQPPMPQEQLAMANIRLSIEDRPETSFAVLVPQPLCEQIIQKNTPAEDGNKVAAGEADFSPAEALNYAAGKSSDTVKVRPHQKDNIEMLLDVDLDVTIELGRSTLSIKRILELAPGSIIELDRMAGEPVDLRVNSKIVAKGEVVVVDENFGIRILSLLSPEERIKSLG